MKSEPKIRAIILCDGAMKVGSKWSLQGVFTRIVSPKYPTDPITFFLYFQIADLSIRPESSLVAEVQRTAVEDLEGKTKPVCGGELTFGVVKGEFPILNNQLMEFAMPFPSAVFPESGFYDVSFFIDGRLIEVHTLEAMLVENRRA